MKNLLISRMRAERCLKIANNPFIRGKFKIFTVDHTSIRKYQNLGFIKSYQFPSVGYICFPVVDDAKEKEIYEFCLKILQENNIDLVLNAQPLHPLNTIMQKACQKLKILIINTETFCDDKWFFDFKGCQYTEHNEIFKYVNRIPINNNLATNFPKSTRQLQPLIISKNQFFAKYKLLPIGMRNYIVLLGQLIWDMSLKKSMNTNIQTYQQYIDLIVRQNPNTIFIVKHHPLYLKSSRKKDIEFINKYPNVKIVNESIDTLFNIFDCFTSFSSTTVFEGLLKTRKFATIGYHLCNNDKLVIQLKKNFQANNLYEQLKNFQIEQKLRHRYLRFICNYYAIDLSSKQLYDRLVLTSDEYFGREL